MRTISVAIGAAWVGIACAGCAAGAGPASHGAVAYPAPAPASPQRLAEKRRDLHARAEPSSHESRACAAKVSVTPGALASGDPHHFPNAAAHANDAPASDADAVPPAERMAGLEAPLQSELERLEAPFAEATALLEDLAILPALLRTHLPPLEPAAQARWCADSITATVRGEPYLLADGNVPDAHVEQQIAALADRFQGVLVRLAATRASVEALDAAARRALADLSRLWSVAEAPLRVTLRTSDASDPAMEQARDRMEQLASLRVRVYYGVERLRARARELSASADATRVSLLTAIPIASGQTESLSIR